MKREDIPNSEITTAMVQERALKLHQERVNSGLQPNWVQDWEEAEKQLLAEREGLSNKPK